MADAAVWCAVTRSGAAKSAAAHGSGPSDGQATATNAHDATHERQWPECDIRPLELRGSRERSFAKWVSTVVTRRMLPARYHFLANPDEMRPMPGPMHRFVGVRKTFDSPIATHPMRARVRSGRRYVLNTSL